MNLNQVFVWESDSESVFFPSVLARRGGVVYDANRNCNMNYVLGVGAPVGVVYDTIIII